MRLFVWLVVIAGVAIGAYLVFSRRATRVPASTLLPVSTLPHSQTRVPACLQPKVAAIIDTIRKREGSAQRLRAVRTTGSSILPCGVWEQRHQQGRAADVLVEDWNCDSQVTLEDVLLFARSVDEVERANPETRGCCALFASERHTAGGHISDPISLIHLDLSGASDRWAQIDRADGTVTFANWWKGGASLKERRRGAKLQGMPLNVLVLKKPSLFFLEPDSNEFTLLPCVVVNAGEQPLKVYPAGLGFAPEGDKERKGDGRTPEGEFRIVERNRKSRFHKSLRLSYPVQRHAAAALRAKRISKDEHRRILRALRARKTPPQGTALGGDIMIHGGGVGSNWTLGCVALRNEDIDALFSSLPLRTKVTVRPVQ